MVEKTTHATQNSLKLWNQNDMKLFDIIKIYIKIISDMNQKATKMSFKFMIAPIECALCEFTHAIVYYFASMSFAQKPHNIFPFRFMKNKIVFLGFAFHCLFRLIQTNIFFFFFFWIEFCFVCESNHIEWKKDA